LELQSEPWQRDLAAAVTDPAELLGLLDLDPAALPALDPAATDFALRVPRYFVNLMRRGDPHDPLLAQVLPLAAEQLSVAGYRQDPVGDMHASHDHGVLKKYHGRVLMIATGACAIHCRYCFRRHFPYTEQSLLGHWTEAMKALRGLPGTEELILSGGDPLCLSDRRLGDLLEQTRNLPGLRRLRIHSRLPVVLPQRVTDRLVSLLSEQRLPTVLVIHANHPNEITPELGRALQRLAAAGVTLLNQSVLLKSVNDYADTLAELSDVLFGIGVMPYYLHLLDPVDGAAHFAVPLHRAQELQEQLHLRLPGYLVPRMVRELPGEPYKTPVLHL
jgi:EF-P beta-lysylation protein EpmB